MVTAHDMTRTIVLVLSILGMCSVGSASNAECVIVLHGLARTSSSMEPVAAALRDQGYTVANVDYPSREKSIEELAPLAVATGLNECPAEAMVHFVTHSLGGILVRYYLERNELSRLGRVVMIAPPNRGSEVVDKLQDVPGFAWLNGPAGMQLGTDENSVPSRLGAVGYKLGVIAGTATVNPILSQYLPNPDDGKVSVESTKVDGMRDFVIVERSHTFIMRAPEVIAQVVSFLANGRFKRDEP